MTTAIVILNWNGRMLMETFLPPLIASTKGLARVIVADNASTDDSVTWLKENYSDVEIVRNNTNEGFAKGYNTALKQVDADYFVLLNSDVEVAPGWLEPLIQHLNQNPGTAVCQPKLRWYKHQDRFEYAGAAGGYVDKLGYPFCRGRIFGDLEKDHGQYDTVIPVFWASGACMMVRSKVFKEAGGFDEAFFAHMEEIDLCWRIRNLGYEIDCVPMSMVFHIGGATLPKNNPGKTLLNFRNNLSMMYKNLPGNRVLPVILVRLVLDGVAAVKFLFEGHIWDFTAVFKAHTQFYLRILNRTIRRESNTKGKLHSTIYTGSIVYDHYILRKKKFTDLDFHPGKPKK